MRSIARFHGLPVVLPAGLLLLGLLGGCGGGTSGTADALANTTNASPGRAAVQSASTGDTALLATVSSATVARHLFVPDLTHQGLVSLPTLTPDAGEVLPAPTLSVNASWGDNVQVDASRDELYAIVGHQVRVYANASLLGAASTPTRTITLPSTLTAPHVVFLDTADDTLYVGGDTAQGDGEIVVYASAHGVSDTVVMTTVDTVVGTTMTATATAMTTSLTTTAGTADSRAAPPSRTMFIDHGVTFFTLDAVRDRLYVVNADAGVHVFDGVDTASGVLHASTSIAVLGTGLAIDTARDRLYVADTFAGLILVDAASAPDPIVTATISIDDARFVAIDAVADRAYVSAQAGLYVLDNASELTSTTTLPAPAVGRTAATNFGTAAWR